MGTVMIRCPRTGQAISTGIEMEPSVLDRLPLVQAWRHCPACGEEHAWDARTAWLSEPMLVTASATEDETPPQPVSSLP